MSATVQGFGAVGAHTANLLSKHGVAIRAVSTYYGALVSTTADGLDIGTLFTIWKEQGDESFKQYEDSPPPGTRSVHRDQIFEEEAEIFIPAARTDVLAMPGEPQMVKGAKDIMRFAEATGVKVVLEGANHPLTDEAEKYLESRGVFILPDYLVNCGGLIGCWADWVYRSELEGADGKTWHDRLNDSAPRYVAKVVENNVPRVLEATGGKPDGIRKASHNLARELRDEFRKEFEEHPSARSQVGDGRIFARSCMDRLLV
jgi:glutamate dehydrogenase/leucine dehydrogenase